MKLYNFLSWMYKLEYHWVIGKKNDCGSFSADILSIFFYFSFFFNFRFRLRCVEEWKLFNLFQLFTVFPRCYFASSLPFPDNPFCYLTQQLFGYLIVQFHFKLFLVPFPASLSCIFTVNGKTFCCNVSNLVKVRNLSYILQKKCISSFKLPCVCLKFSNK